MIWKGVGGRPPEGDRERVESLLSILEPQTAVDNQAISSEAVAELEWNLHQQAAATELAQWVSGSSVLPGPISSRIYQLLRRVFFNPNLKKHISAVSAHVGLLKASHAGIENFNEVQQARILQWSMEQELQGPVRGPPEKASSPKKKKESESCDSSFELAGDEVPTREARMAIRKAQQAKVKEEDDTRQRIVDRYIRNQERISSPKPGNEAGPDALLP
jgi:hypothetical protein